MNAFLNQFLKIEYKFCKFFQTGYIKYCPVKCVQIKLIVSAVLIVTSLIISSDQFFSTEKQMIPFSGCKT